MDNNLPPDESTFENNKGTPNPLETPEGFKAAIFKEFEKVTKPIPHSEITERLLEKVAPVNFMEVAGLEPGKDKPKKKHFLVISIEKVLQLAKDNQWGMCRNHDFIYLFNGAHWSLFDAEELKGFLGSAAEKMGVEKYDAKHYAFRDQLFKQFLALANLPTPELPKDKVLVNLRNGTFEIAEKATRLRKFKREDFLTYQLPFAYEPGANAPIFRKYLDRVLPDKALQNILAEYLAYVFIPPSTLKLEKTLLLYGTGANGKSVFFEIVNALLGKENVSSYSLQSLTNETGYFRAKLANMLVNYASEINGNLETSIFKALVSGEPVEARLPYGEPFTLTRYAKLIFNCNELPRNVEHTNAYFRRFLIVPFDVTIPEDEQDRQLPTKIIGNELSGVFNWVLDGLKRLLEQKGFTESEVIKRQVEIYKKQSDTVQLFLEENEIKPSPDNYLPQKDLYREYSTFCLECGYGKLNLSNFKRRLEALGLTIQRMNIGNVVFVERPSPFP